ncbi:MAG: DUF996 domain-containing protein [Bacteroidales bacterium]
MKRQAITLGRIGILLPIASIIPFLGAVAGLAAMVLLLISHYNFSKIYEKPDIFKNALTGTIIVVAANVIGGILVTIGVGTAIFESSGGALESFDYQEITSQIFGSGLSIVGAIIMFIGAIIGIYFVYKALQVLAEQSNINLFKTGGLLYLIGVITSVILIGGLVIFVGWILHIIAYFSLQPEQETAMG